MYNLYFHPLSSFSGPAYLVASDVPLALLQLRGISYHVLDAAHRKYGNVVRIAPNTLSFIEPEAWQDIYGNRKGRPSLAVLPKDPHFYSEMLLEKETITISSDEDAAPIRRSMNAAFSPSALLESEPMLREHTLRLMAQLAATADTHGHVDVQAWFTFSMFDITSDFGFGDDLGCVRRGAYHEWVEFVLEFFYAATLLHQCHKFWPLNRLLAACIPPAVRAKKRQHSAASVQRVRRRMNMATDRSDFMSHFLRQARKEQLSTPVIEAQASVVILAGSETSAVALTAATYQILADPAVHAQLRDEVRSAFATPDDLTLQAVLTMLPYLGAVVKETLRMHAPLANGFTRVVPTDGPGAVISGHWVPPTVRLLACRSFISSVDALTDLYARSAQTIVTINHYCCNRSARNFRDPHAFVPERWLDAPTYASDKRSVVQPFSVGPRDCPGKRYFLIADLGRKDYRVDQLRRFALNNIHYVLARLFWSFDMELTEGTEGWAVDQKIFNGWRQPPLPILLRERTR